MSPKIRDSPNSWGLCSHTGECNRGSSPDFVEKKYGNPRFEASCLTRSGINAQSIKASAYALPPCSKYTRLVPMCLGENTEA